MKSEQKQLNMLGLAMRARELISGDELVYEAIKKKRVHLVICGKDASPSTKERYQFICQKENVPLHLEFTKDEISIAIGKSRTICAMTNRGMANKFLSYQSE